MLCRHTDTCLDTRRRDALSKLLQRHASLIPQDEKSRAAIVLFQCSIQNLDRLVSNSGSGHEVAMVESR